jgi:AraC family transcriptional regulator, exoenzyme S synthesis regulatory protein ExsA
VKVCNQLHHYEKMQRVSQYNVPRYFVGNQNKIPLAFTAHYQITKSTVKNRVVLTTHMFSFLTEGTKEIVMGNAGVKFDKKDFVLVASGKCFMSEKLSHQGRYTCSLLFFDHELLQTFFEHYKLRILETIEKNDLRQKEILLFKNDDYTTSYTASLNYIPNKSEELAKVKLHEILLYLLETQPNELCCLFAAHPKTSDDIRFRNVITSHIDSNLSLNELAYLCNVSLSTFKRKFTAIFNDSPTNWMRQKRMEHAAFLLKYNKERVSDIYLRFGYENHSSFSQSFKMVFGVSPKEYKLQD